MNTVRLARFLSQAGVASRRHAEELILDGRVSVDGVIVKRLATLIDARTNVVLVDGKRASLEPLVYYLVHKPVGYVSTVSDIHAARRVIDLVPKHPHVYPVGRLDKESSGLIILTNDGDFAQRLMHPRYESKKVYRVTIDQPVTRALDMLRRGVRLTEGMARADAMIKVDERTFEMTIHQGWYRQVRRMVSACGARVKSLVRISEGTIKLGTLKEGEYRPLTAEERHQ